jgi:hypothetical protein
MKRFVMLSLVAAALATGVRAQPIPGTGCPGVPAPLGAVTVSSPSTNGWLCSTVFNATGVFVGTTPSTALTLPAVIAICPPGGVCTLSTPILFGKETVGGFVFLTIPPALAGFQFTLQCLEVTEGVCLTLSGTLLVTVV